MPPISIVLQAASTAIDLAPRALTRRGLARAATLALAGASSVSTACAGRRTATSGSGAAANGVLVNVNDLLNDYRKADIDDFVKGPKQRLSWITNDGWGMWNGSRVRPAAWELTKFIVSPEWFRLQSRIELLIPSRVSLLDDWIQVLRQNFPNFAQVDLKGVRDGLATSPPVVSTWRQFLCSQEAREAINPIHNQLYRDGTAKPSVLRDNKDQIDRAASTCGLSLKSASPSAASAVPPTARRPVAITRALCQRLVAMK